MDRFDFDPATTACSDFLSAPAPLSDMGAGHVADQKCEPEIPVPSEPSRIGPLSIWQDELAVAVSPICGPGTNVRLPGRRSEGAFPFRLSSPEVSRVPAPVWPGLAPRSFNLAIDELTLECTPPFYDEVTLAIFPAIFPCPIESEEQGPIVPRE